MKIETLLITPKQASELLKQNVNNRPLQKHRVLLLFTEMMSGRWKEETGEAIKISKTNRLLDGQHRLAALVKSQQSLKFLVISGLDDQIFDVIDTGKSRTSKDVFSIANVKYYNMLPSALVLYNHITVGYVSHRSIQNVATNARLMEQYEERKEFWDSVMVKTQHWYGKANKLLTMSEIAAHYAIYVQINANKAEEFMNMLCTGMLINNNTIYSLRSKLIDAKVDKTHRMLPDVKNALIIKTWNACRTNRVITRLKYLSDNEQFPIAI